MSDEAWTHVFRALPWILLPILILWRLSRSRHLRDESAEPPVPAPVVSIILPARNEARHIEACVRSILSTTYPALELIVVDDHSTDGTGKLARAAIGDDRRGEVIVPPPLPPEWFGKQWACWTGARAAKGAILLFADADTRHAPDLVVRAVNAMRSRNADLLSVMGRQEMHTFWERMLQPQIFGIFATRYGNTEWIERSPFVHDKIANGQCFLMTRDAYDTVGGHEAVKHNVAEDLMIAQCAFRLGKRVSAVGGTEQLSTRMYESLGEIIRGWGKNIFAAGRHTLPFGTAGRLVYAVIMVPSMGLLLLPLLMVVLALLGVLSRDWLVDGVVAYLIVLFWGVVVRIRMQVPPWDTPLYPLAAIMMLYIGAYATIRGRNVEWKGRRYVSS